MTKSLKLTPDQQRDVRAVYAAIEGRAKAMRDQGADQDEIRRTLRAMRENSRKQIEPILDEAQREKFREMVRKRDRSANRRAQLWVVNGAGDLTPVSVSIGISDGSVTELVRGDLQEGQPVVVAQIKGAASAPRRSPFGF
jgi:hypothetical protein